MKKILVFCLVMTFSAISISWGANSSLSIQKETTEEKMVEFLEYNVGLETLYPVLLTALDIEEYINSLNRNSMDNELKFIVQMVEISLERIISTIVSKGNTLEFKVQFLLEEIEFLRKVLPYIQESL